MSATPTVLRLRRPLLWWLGLQSLIRDTDMRDIQFRIARQLRIANVLDSRTNADGIYSIELPMSMWDRVAGRFMASQMPILVTAARELRIAQTEAYQTWATLNESESERANVQ